MKALYPEGDKFKFIDAVTEAREAEVAQTGKAQAWKSPWDQRACVRKDSGVQISPSALLFVTRQNLLTICS